MNIIRKYRTTTYGKDEMVTEISIHDIPAFINECLHSVPSIPNFKNCHVEFRVKDEGIRGSFEKRIPWKAYNEIIQMESDNSLRNAWTKKPSAYTIIILEERPPFAFNLPPYFVYPIFPKEPPIPQPPQRTIINAIYELEVI